MRWLSGHSGTFPQWLPQCRWRTRTTQTPLPRMLDSPSHWRRSARNGARGSGAGMGSAATGGAAGTGAAPAADRLAGAGAREPGCCQGGSLLAPGAVRCRAGAGRAGALATGADISTGTVAAGATPAGGSGAVLAEGSARSVMISSSGVRAGVVAVAATTARGAPGAEAKAGASRSNHHASPPARTIPAIAAPAYSANGPRLETPSSRSSAVSAGASCVGASGWAAGVGFVVSNAVTRAAWV